jgi:hypothetical protein
MPDTAPAYKGFRVYPRGFLGASLGEQIKPTERSAAASLRSYQYHPDWFKAPASAKEINQNIEALWAKLNDSYGAMDSMEFREKVLRIALNAFGTQNFYDWINVQISGPSTGDIHMRFLQDMLEFIETGKHQMSLHNWSGLLSLSEITHNETPNEGQFNWFFITGDKRPKNMQLVDVIQRWCSQPNGFIDLAHTLHVLFGEV